MDNSPEFPPLARMLALNIEAHETRKAMMREPVASGRIGDLQENMDRCRRAILATCWLSDGYYLEEYDLEEEEDGLGGESDWDLSGAD